MGNEIEIIKINPPVLAGFARKVLLLFYVCAMSSSFVTIQKNHTVFHQISVPLSRNQIPRRPLAAPITFLDVLLVTPSLAMVSPVKRMEVGDQPDVNQEVAEHSPRQTKEHMFLVKNEECKQGSDLQ